MLEGGSIGHGGTKAAVYTSKITKGMERGKEFT